MFYHSDDGDVEDILESMETLDDNMDAEEVSTPTKPSLAAGIS